MPLAVSLVTPLRINNRCPHTASKTAQPHGTQPNLSKDAAQCHKQVKGQAAGGSRPRPAAGLALRSLSSPSALCCPAVWVTVPVVGPPWCGSAPQSPLWALSRSGQWGTKASIRAAPPLPIPASSRRATPPGPAGIVTPPPGTVTYRVSVASWVASGAALLLSHPPPPANDRSRRTRRSGVKGGCRGRPRPSLATHSSGGDDAHAIGRLPPTLGRCCSPHPTSAGLTVADRVGAAPWEGACVRGRFPPIRFRGGGGREQRRVFRGGGGGGWSRWNAGHSHPPRAAPPASQRARTRWSARAAL